ncbi:N-(5'-phosphoribosyl)anthranilate isomerase [Sporosarcina sp. NCCP-2716]|uniref:phosphoribosylanthranilate isomerase n=1 Tax=Sporosarcina sp. NCCP-2716 TaxID=2943679 RepID=UPI00203E0EC7|nr:phosphoribosylanthranilate isomerase [Sporosarcina sp. NCCP-2716]GKV68508.1 N-(5'-phosphoribosyl)anthranilate isomerase [Sporosarcina sp. NCCP-2716]
MTKVKICGLSEAVHVKAAVDAGADAIGFVFAPSARRITPEKAAELAADIPASVLKIGVFADAPPAEIRRIAETVPLDMIQYHGDETDEEIRAIGLPAMKSFSIRTVTDLEPAAGFAAWPLFDAPGIDHRGGSGRTFDWQLLEEAGFAGRPFVLAGGLDEGNVSEAIRRLRPMMVDVSSGVERNKRKDEQLIRAFIRRVKQTK